MFSGLIIYPTAPIWLLSGASFLVAVIIVAVLEVSYIEINYIIFKQKLKKMGFHVEEYYETRFFISSKEPQKDLLKKISKEFKLYDIGVLNYEDKYFENNLKEYSGRMPRVRIRKRDDYCGKKIMKTLQIIYTRARESSVNRFDQYRFFPIKKNKFYYLLEDKIPKNIDEIDSSKIRNLLKYSQKYPPRHIKFKRAFARNEDLLITLDSVSRGKKYYLLEAKVRKNTKLLIAAMRYIMQEFPVVQTTKGKLDYFI